jgi:hypothetical protein
VIVRRPNRTQYGHKYIRAVRSETGGVLYQARAWHPVVGSISIGCFRSEHEATKAVKAWLRAGCDPCKGLAEGVLPKWTRRVVGGGFQGIYRNPATIWTGPARSDPITAHHDSIEWLTSQGLIPVQGRRRNREKQQQSRSKPAHSRDIQQLADGWHLHINEPGRALIAGPFASLPEAERVRRDWLAIAPKPATPYHRHVTAFALPDGSTEYEVHFCWDYLMFASGPCSTADEAADKLRGWYLATLRELRKAVQRKAVRPRGRPRTKDRTESDDRLPTTARSPLLVRSPQLRPGAVEWLRSNGKIPNF